MKPRWKIVLTVLATIFAFCNKPGPQFVPADEQFLRKPADRLTVDEMKKMRALVKTDYGDFTIGFHPDQAPQLCRNFIKLIEQGFYDQLTFHLIVPNYMIITGDPTGNGTGGPGYWLKLEINSLPHRRGAVGMSHPPFSPDQLGSQFYVMLSQSFKESNAYPVFGYVERGMDVCDRIGEIKTNGAAGKPRPWTPQTAVKVRDIVLLVEESR